MLNSISEEDEGSGIFFRGEKDLILHFENISRLQDTPPNINALTATDVWISVSK